MASTSGEQHHTLNSLKDPYPISTAIKPTLFLAADLNLTL